MADHGLKDNVALVVHLKPIVRQTYGEGQQYGEAAGGGNAARQGGAQGRARRREGGGEHGGGSSDMELDVGVGVDMGAAAGEEGGGVGGRSGGEAAAAAEAAVAAMLGRPAAAGALERRSSGSKRSRSGGPQSREGTSVPQQGQQQGQQQQPVLDRRFRPPFAAAGAFPEAPGHEEQGGATEEGADGGRGRSRSRSKGRGRSRGREVEEGDVDGPGVLVANTHILFNTKRGDIKLGQVGSGLTVAWVEVPLRNGSNPGHQQWGGTLLLTTVTLLLPAMTRNQAASAGFAAACAPGDPEWENTAK